MVLIVLPNIGSVFSGDGLGGVPGCAILLLYLCFGRNHTTYGRLYTYVLSLFRVSDDERGGRIRPRLSPESS